METEASISPQGSPRNRSKSPHRIHYEAQVEVIRRQLGDLEKIRQDWGLSQRKICQLLMVDPSAWTRWTKQGEMAPPHIYRALQWYGILQEKIPGLTPQYFIGKDPEVLHQRTMAEIHHQTQRREEFEEALSQRALFLSSELEDLRSSHAAICHSERELKNQIELLKASHRRSLWISLGFGFLMFAGLMGVWTLS